MLSLGALSFASPWLLTSLLALPALWWWLRVTPPPPRRFDFPAVRLLFGLTSNQQTARSAPLWLILLRLTLIVAVILAASGPGWRRDLVVSDGPWLIVIDNGWASGKSWTQRRQKIMQFIDQAERDQQTVTILPTAIADGGALSLAGPMPAGTARAVAASLQPLPWRGDRRAALQALAQLKHGRAMRVIWISDGLDEGDSAPLAQQLQTYGRLEMVLPEPDQRAQILLPPGPDQDQVGFRLLRPAGGGARQGTLRAQDEQGRALALLDIDWADKAVEAKVSAAWPTELKARIARLTIDGENHAGATILLDAGWSRHAVGLVDMGGNDKIALLDDLFYAERALGRFAEARRGSVEALLQRPLSMIILPDRGALPEPERALLRQWINDGGTLLRFAGPALAGNPDDLLPVRIRVNERLLGGSLSWQHPLSVAKMPEQGPFAGLEIPPDLTVSAQILAEPDLTLATKIWAKLEDGTPLVTGVPLGKGWLVLFHSTAWPGWSNLALSGLFPEMLHRLLDRSRGLALVAPDHPLAALSQLDGFGQLTAPGPNAEAWPADGAVTSLGPRHPPGYYGENNLRRAVNLSPTLPPLKPLDLPAGAVPVDLGLPDHAIDLTPLCLGLALFLLFADLLLLTGIRRHSAAALLLLAAITCRAEAADPIAAALDTRLAYAVTGDAQIDALSAQGLGALTRQIVRRTTAVIAEPAAIDLERDQLSVYPLIYWPLSQIQPPLSPQAVARLNDFMRHGGLLLIDSRDGGSISAERMRQVTKGIDIPPLAPVTDQHVLARSFYLLESFPGKLSGAGLFAEQGGDAGHDFVSPVLIGGNDYAGGWADERNGDNQREMALRFGVNLVIYALTGSYKADQVHVPTILERMHR